MRIGIDFDNTIVSYDRLFHALAVEQGLIPPDVPASKEQVRNHLRRAGREDDWTELQGYVYGARMAEAAAFAGVYDFFHRCRELGIETAIISHKTQFPFRGPAWDLHRAARDWLEQQGFHDPHRIALPRQRAYFETTLEAKLRRIEAAGCTHFVDDLPELLTEPSFPAGVVRILFDPHDHHACEQRFQRARSWEQLATELLCGAPL